MSSTDISYGSDQNGLVWAYEFSAGTPGKSLDTDAADALIAKSDLERGASFYWLHFSLANAQSQRWLRSQSALPPAFSDSLSDTTGSTRLEQDDDWLIAVLHDVVFDNVSDTPEVSTVTLCVGRRAVVSARPRALRSIDRLRAAVKAGEQFRSSAELLIHLLRDQADVLVDIVRRFTKDIDAIEDNLLRHRLSTSRTELGSMRRRLVRLQRLLAPEPAALFRLLSSPPPWIAENDIQDMREAAEEFSTAITDSAALTERLKLIQEELSALVSEENNKILYVLTLVTVLAVPFNVVAGLFGMNVGGLPWGDNPYGFVLVVAMVTAATGGLAWYMEKLRKQ